MEEAASGWNAVVSSNERPRQSVVDDGYRRVGVWIHEPLPNATTADEESPAT